MGLNFHVRCKTHKVVASIYRGEESEVLHRFYKAHEECRKADPNAVEVQADEASEQPWMSVPPPEGYTDLGVLEYDSATGGMWPIAIRNKLVCEYCGDVAPHGDARISWLLWHADSRIHRVYQKLKKKLRWR